MFDPQKEVPSLEFCKRLKRFGYPQDSGGFYWTVAGDSCKLEYVKDISFAREVRQDLTFYKAPTIGEMLDYLGKSTSPDECCKEILNKIRDKFNVLELSKTEAREKMVKVELVLDTELPIEEIKDKFKILGQICSERMRLVDWRFLEKKKIVIGDKIGDWTVEGVEGVGNEKCTKGYYICHYGNTRRLKWFTYLELDDLIK